MVLHFDPPPFWTERTLKSHIFHSHLADPILFNFETNTVHFGARIVKNGGPKPCANLLSKIYKTIKKVRGQYP